MTPRFARVVASSLHQSKIASDALLSLADQVEALTADAARLNWALPILVGDDSDLANARALALAAQLIKGLDGKPALDAAMKAAP